MANEINLKEKCHYCKKSAKYQLKNGLWCCSENHANCPLVQKKWMGYKANMMKPEYWFQPVEEDIWESDLTI